MKVKKYNEMMAYLTRKKEPTIRLPVTKYDEPTKKTKPKVREETIFERIESIHHIYDGGPKPKHIDNKNIKFYEDMQTINKVIDYSPNKTKRPQPFKKIKKNSRPVNIDISVINRDLSKYEQILNTPDPKYKLREKEKLEEIETILGIKA